MVDSIHSLRPLSSGTVAATDRRPAASPDVRSPAGGYGESEIANPADLRDAAWISSAGALQVPYCYCPATGQLMFQSHYGLQTPFGWKIETFAGNVRARFWCDPSAPVEAS